MPAQTYSFIRFPSEHRSYTRLPLLIRNPANGARIATMGLIDTGADSTLFPASLALRLGHDLKGRKVRTTVTSGVELNPITAYRHTFEVALLSPTMKRIVWSASLEIDCVETNPPLLLGVDDFLRCFKLTIDYPAETVRLKW